MTRGGEGGVLCNFANHDWLLLTHSTFASPHYTVRSVFSKSTYFYERALRVAAFLVSEGCPFFMMI